MVGQVMCVAKAHVPRVLAAVVVLVGTVTIGLAVAQVPVAASDGPAPVCASGTCTVTFDYTGAAQTWSVPPGVTSGTFTLIGAEGGTGRGLISGGLGAEISGTLPLTAGTSFEIFVGGAGGGYASPSSNLGGGGFNGGGNGGNPGFPETGGGGGGASDIRTGPFGLADRIMVAAGGGGGGESYGWYGGAGGAAAGITGDSGSNAPNYVGTNETMGGGVGGGGGGSTSGGAGGLGGTAGAVDSSCLESSPLAGTAGSTGSLGDGGAGSTGVEGNEDSYGGGGGGGYYGGGGGGSGAEDTSCYSPAGGGGGGSGSSYFGSATHTEGPSAQAAPADAPNGEVTISYLNPLSVSPSVFSTEAGQSLVESAQAGALSTASAPSSDSIEASLVSEPSNGAVSLSSDGSFTYTPDTNFSGDDSFVVQVSDASGDYVDVTETVSVQPNPQQISFTSVPPQNPTVGGSYQPTATGGGSGNAVTFSIDPGSTTGACTLSGSTGPVVFTGAGNCIIDANQDGSGAYNPASQVQQIIAIANEPTTGVVVRGSITSRRPTFGSKVELRSTISSLSGGQSPSSGTVSFVAGRTSLCVTGVADGIATCRTSHLPRAGRFSIEVRYSGSSDFSASSASFRVDVRRQRVSMTTSIRPLPGGEAQYVASVRASHGDNRPRGSVTFSSGRKRLCAAQLHEGTARCDAGQTTFQVRAIYRPGKDYLTADQVVKQR